MSAGDRLQIVLAAKNEISSELKQTKAEMNDLGRTAAALKKRMDAGEQGLQNEYEQTRRELEKNRLKQIELGRAASKAQAEIRQLTTEGTTGARKMGRSFDGATRSMDKTHRATMTMSSGWAKVTGVIAGAATVVYSLQTAFRFLGDSIGEAREQRKALAQLDAVMKSMGRTEAPDEIARLVTSLSLMSGLDDDEILSSVDLMLTFGEVTGDTFKKAERAALDLSTAFHMKLQSATVMVGKALNNPIGGLTSLMRIGVAFTEQQKEQIKGFMEEGELAKAQGIIMAELKRQVDGSARAQADAIDRTRAAWKNFKQTVGDVLMDAISKLAGMGKVDPAKGLKRAADWIQLNRKEIIQSLMQMAGWTLKFASATARMGEVAVAVYADLTTMLGGMIVALGWLGKSDDMKAFGQSLIDAGAQADQGAVGLGKIADQLDRLGTKALNAADGLNRTTTAWQDLKSAGVSKRVLESSRNIPKFAAMGGPVFGPTVVGELGPELFVPTVGSPRVIGADGPEILDFHTSGTVIPNHLLVPAMAATTAPAPVAVPSGPGVHIENLTVQDRFDARRELEALMRKEARIRSERGA